MEIITISGKARHGKDFTANIMKDKLEQDNKRVLIAHFGDLVKYTVKTFFGWNGKKDEEGRTKLQYIGTDVIRKQKPNYWVDFIVSILKMFPNEWDYVIIPDARFPNEIDTFKNEGFNITTVRVIRPNFDSDLTVEQMQHISETALDDYNDYDFKIINDKSEVELYNNTLDILKKIEKEGI